MKKFEKPGRVLSKKEQKQIKGGPVDPDPENKCKKTGSCSQDSECGWPDVDCICGTTSVDPNPKCYWIG